MHTHAILVRSPLKPRAQISKQANELTNQFSRKITTTCLFAPLRYAVARIDNFLWDD